jgi:hypothetical protein
VSARTIRRVLRRPSSFYVNVHNADFPDGAIRGQLEEEEAEDQGAPGADRPSQPEY